MTKRNQFGWQIMMAICLCAPVAAQSAPSVPAEKPVTLDRVIAIINGEVLLESDVREEMHLAVLQPISVPAGQNTSLRAARRLTSRALILRQMKEQQQIDYSVSDDELKQSLMELRTQLPDCREMHCATDQGWQAFLSKSGLTEKEVDDYWKRRLEVLKFVQVRFGQGIRIPRQDIQKYYQTNVVSAFEKQNQKPPTLESVTPRIREVLLQQQVNALLRDWLESLREQGNVQVVDPAYAQIAPKEDEDSGGGGA